jgi:hypothetical protein
MRENDEGGCEPEGTAGRGDEGNGQGRDFGSLGRAGGCMSLNVLVLVLALQREVDLELESVPSAIGKWRAEVGEKQWFLENTNVSRVVEDRIVKVGGSTMLFENGIKTNTRRLNHNVRSRYTARSPQNTTALSANLACRTI